MAIVVEDGTGLESANSYNAILTLDAYFEARNVTAWADAADEDKEAAALNATVYLDGRYGSRWPGIRLKETQALDWPRYGAYDRDGYVIASNSVPAKVKDAHAELCLAGLTEDLAASLSRGGLIKREKVGPLETEYADGAPAGRSFPMVDMMLSRIIRLSSSQVALVRA